MNYSFSSYHSLTRQLCNCLPSHSMTSQAFSDAAHFQIDVLSRTVSRQELSENGGMHKASTLTQPSGPRQLLVPCHGKCGELYCSQTCSDTHWFSGHCLLCTGPITEEQVLGKWVEMTHFFAISSLCRDLQLFTSPCATRSWSSFDCL